MLHSRLQYIMFPVQLLYEGAMCWQWFEYLDPLRQRFQFLEIPCTMAVSLTACLCQDVQQQGAVARRSCQIAIHFFYALPSLSSPL